MTERVAGEIKQAFRQISGVLPAAGKGERIAPLPCSKELFPVGFHKEQGRKKQHPKVVSHYLLEKMRAAGAVKAFVIIRDGKWDIPAYFGDGEGVDMDLAYLMMNRPDGAPYTVDQAYPFLQQDIVIFGFPDILFTPDNVFELLLEKQEQTNSDIVLGLFPADNPHKMDMVDLDAENKIRDICIKPNQTDLLYTWIVAVWTPVFSRFMHRYLQQDAEKVKRELFVGDVVLAAIHAGIPTEAVLFDQGRYVDIGTPEDLARAVQGAW